MKCWPQTPWDHSRFMISPFISFNKGSSLYNWPPRFWLLGLWRAFMYHIYQMAVTQLAYRHEAHKRELKRVLRPGASAVVELCTPCPGALIQHNQIAIFWCIAPTARLKTGSALDLLSDTKLLAVNYLYDFGLIANFYVALFFFFFAAKSTMLMYCVVSHVFILQETLLALGWLSKMFHKFDKWWTCSVRFLQSRYYSFSPFSRVSH